MEKLFIDPHTVAVMAAISKPEVDEEDKQIFEMIKNRKPAEPEVQQNNEISGYIDFEDEPANSGWMSALACSVAFLIGLSGLVVWLCLGNTPAVAIVAYIALMVYGGYTAYRHIMY